MQQISKSEKKKDQRYNFLKIARRGRKGNKLNRYEISKGTKTNISECMRGVSGRKMWSTLQKLERSELRGRLKIYN